MKIESFDEDLFELKSFAARLEKFIQVEQRFVPESLVLSLNASFGSGKTTFLDMWKHQILQESSFSEDPIVVDVNAWNDDFCGDPLVALIKGLIQGLKIENKETSELEEAARDVGWLLTAYGNQVLNKITGLDLVAANEFVEKKASERLEKSSPPNDFFELYENKSKALAALKNAIKNIIKSENRVILVLVDELDRCRPDYAISFLETIKHVFDIAGVVFVLAVDRGQLECSAKAAFGSDLVFSEYYRKFVHREIPLPIVSQTGLERLAERYINCYLKNDVRNCIANIDIASIRNLTKMMGSLRLTVRQIQEVFRIMGHVFDSANIEGGSLKWCIGTGSMLMSVLRLARPGDYHKLGTLSMDKFEAAELARLLDIDRADWWFLLILTGGGIGPVKSVESAEEILKQVGFEEEQLRGKISRIGEWYMGWGNIDTRLSDVYSKIESISSW